MTDPKPKTIDSILAHYVGTKRKTIDPHELRTIALEGWAAGIDSIRRRAPLDLRGCGDHGCVVAKPRGMGTNGGCHCEERALRMAVLALRAELDRVNAVHAIEGVAALPKAPGESLSEPPLQQSDE